MFAAVFDEEWCEDRSLFRPWAASRDVASGAELRPLVTLAAAPQSDILSLRGFFRGEVSVEEGGEYMSVSDRNLDDFFKFDDASESGGGVSKARKERVKVCRVLFRVE